MYDFEKDYCYTNEVEIDEVIFEDESIDVTLLVRFVNYVTKEKISCSLGCDFSLLNDILFFAYEEAEPVVDKINELLRMGFADDPMVVDVVNLIGKPLLIKGLNLKLFKPQLQKEDYTIYIIDGIERSKGKGSTKKISAKMEFELVKNALADLTILLHNAYYGYQYMKAKGHSEEKARIKAGLVDVQLFRLAKLYHDYNRLSKKCKA